MKRYTVKNNNWLTSDIVTHVKNYKDQCEEIKAIMKLGQLEDIEEELGIDLITLFKLLKKEYFYRCTVYYNNSKKWDKDPNTIFKTEMLGISKYGIIYKESLTGCYMTAQFSDYGKTWALDKQTLEKNKEELENEKLKRS